MNKAKQASSDSAYPALQPCWLEAPLERSPLFFPAFVKISLAIQAALRERVPSAYIVGAAMFENTRVIYPMLVYRASRPFHGKGRADLTYDVLDENMMERFFRKARRNLGTVLSSVVTRLKSDARDDLVRLYEPARAGEIIVSVQKTRKSRSLLYDLLVGESALVNELRQLAGFGSLKSRDRAKKSAELFKAWNAHLRRLCPGRDYRYLGPELLDMASAALAQALAVDAHPPDEVSPMLM